MLPWVITKAHILYAGWKAVWCPPGRHTGSWCIKPSLLHFPTRLHGSKSSCWYILLQLNTCFLEITKDISLWCHVSLQKAVTWNKNKKWGSLLSISQLCFDFLTFFHYRTSLRSLSILVSFKVVNQWDSVQTNKKYGYFLIVTLHFHYSNTPPCAYVLVDSLGRCERELGLKFYSQIFILLRWWKKHSKSFCCQ